MFFARAPRALVNISKMYYESFYGDFCVWVSYGRVGIFAPFAFVTLKSHHTTSRKRPIALVSWLNIPIMRHHYRAKSTRRNFSATKPKGTLDTGGIAAIFAKTTLLFRKLRWFNWYFFIHTESDLNSEPKGVLYAFIPTGASLSMWGISTARSTPQWSIYFF